MLLLMLLPMLLMQPGMMPMLLLQPGMMPMLLLLLLPMLLLQPGMARAMLLLQPGMARAGRAWLGRAGAGRASLEPEIIDDTGRLPKTPRIITQSRPKTDLYKTTPKTILTSLPDPHHPQCRHHVR